MKRNNYQITQKSKLISNETIDIFRDIKIKIYNK